MVSFDEIAENAGNKEYEEWFERVKDAEKDIAAFVATRTGRTAAAAEFAGYLKGSFNLNLRIKFDDEGPQSIIRFPKPGHSLTARHDEKVRNEVEVLELLKAKTTIPVPEVKSWGLKADSPHGLGPFIIMDLLEGYSVASIFMKRITSADDEVVLDDNVDETKLTYFYEQIADYLVQLSRLKFPAVGAISKRPDGHDWDVTGPPFTYNMNEISTVVSEYPNDTFPSHPFDTTQEFLTYLSDENLIHLRTQRNVAWNAHQAEQHFTARHRFRELIPRFCGENQFMLFCDDLRPSNMLADPETCRITAVFDWEFAYAAPAQFSYDPPWWLVLLSPAMWLQNHTIAEFKERYVPRLEQFLRALEKVEERLVNGSGQNEPLLSTKMRESWETGQFWFDYGMRKSYDVDAVYWSALHEKDLGDLTDDQRKEMPDFVEGKMKDLKEYMAECEAQFG